MLFSTAQELMVFDHSGSPMGGGSQMSLVPLEVSNNTENEHNHEHNHEHEHGNNIDVKDEPLVIEVELELVPGAGNSPDPEPEPIEVHEHEDDKSKIDDNDAKSKKSKKWDWESHGATGFIAWIKERCDDVPKHSGLDTAGLERAVAYLEKLDDEISKAMRLDLDGELDANQIEKVRSTIDHGVERLHDRLDKIKKNKKDSRKKKSEFEFSTTLIKEAQKITGVQGVYITVPLLISGIARTCINGMVSAGHDIEQIYHDQVKKYKLNDREKSEVKWLLFDLGYQIRGDRGYFANDNEEYDMSSSDNYDYAANYKG
jgi:hypothetical protein